MELHEARELLSATIPTAEPVLMMGAPGVGKSAIVIQAAKACGYETLTLNPALLDPTDIGGIPILNREGKSLIRALDETLMGLVETNEPTVLFLDELGQASAAMQSACAPIILDRKLGGHHLRDNISVICASNRRQDRAGVSGIVSHLVSRMITVEVETTLTEWIAWALGKSRSIVPEVIGFLRFRPSLLHVWNEDVASKAAVGLPYPCPRSWERVSRVLGLNLPSHVEAPTLMGCVGEGAGREFISYLSQSREIPDVDEMLKEPHQIRWSDEPSKRYALSCAIAWRVSKNPTGVVMAAQGAYQQGHGEFAALILRDAMAIDSSILFNPSFRALNGTPLGNILRG